MDTQASFQSSRLQIQAIHNSVEKLKDIADRMTARALGWLRIFQDFFFLDESNYHKTLIISPGLFW